MKKDKKKGTNKKTWVVDCRTDSAFDFALRVLKEADNIDYPLELRANFIKIAYSNSCETIAKVQTDPRQYKMSSALKLFNRNLKAIFKMCKNMNILDVDIDNYQNNIENPFDYVDIDYPAIEEHLELLKSPECNELPQMNVKDCVQKYNYPKIYEKCIDTDSGEEVIAKILPTNDIIVYLPIYVVEVLLSAKVDNYYLPGEKCKTKEFVYMITGDNHENVIPKPMLIHVPFDSFENVSDLISIAASFPKNVNEICVTAYRLGKDSTLISDIIEATNNKIKCKLYLEISARGEIDQDIIYLNRLLVEADHDYLDLKIRYNGIKVHGKMIYIDLKDNQSIGIFSTGNYNAATTLVYKDYHYISCEKNVTDMIKRNFSVLWNSEQPVLSSISNILSNEIYEEIAKGKNGRIWMQTNHLDNKLIVSLLKEAIRRGCDVKLIVRTTKGFHNRELKNCKTVVGKYLEHARVYIFGSGDERRVYLSSSDILFRNLYNRFESYIKITDDFIEDQLVQDFRELYKNGQKIKKEER